MKLFQPGIILEPRGLFEVDLLPALRMATTEDDSISNDFSRLGDFLAALQAVEADLFVLPI